MKNPSRVRTFYDSPDHFGDIRIKIRSPGETLHCQEILRKMRLTRAWRRFDKSGLSKSTSRFSMAVISMEWSITVYIYCHGYHTLKALMTVKSYQEIISLKQRLARKQRNCLIV